MKLLKTVLMLSLMAGLMFLASCSDDSTGPSNGPKIDNLSATKFSIGEQITINGSNFGVDRGTSYVKFNTTQALDADYISWTETKIVVKVPFGTTSGKVVVKVNNATSNAVSFTIIPLYFPMGQDSWWNYMYYNLDKTGVRADEIGPQKKRITGTIELLGITGNVYTTLTNDIPTGEDYYYSSEGKLYNYSTSLVPAIELPIDIVIPEQWAIIADYYNSNEWTIHTQTIDAFKIENPSGIGPDSIDITGTLTIKGVKKLKQTIQYGANEELSVEAQEFQILYVFAGQAMGALPLNFTVTNHYWYAENIGEVKYKMDPIAIILNIYSFEYEVFSSPGLETVLLDYLIK